MNFSEWGTIPPPRAIPEKTQAVRPQELDAIVQRPKEIVQPAKLSVPVATTTIRPEQFQTSVTTEDYVLDEDFTTGEFDYDELLQG